MKKLLLALAFCTSLAYAADDCSPVAQKIVAKLAKYNKTSLTLNYSSDKAAWAETCKDAITSLNKAIDVKMNPVSGTDIFKPSK